MITRLLPLLYFLLRVALGALYVYAGFTKLIEPVENFRGAIANFELVPYVIVPAIAHVMPWLELILGAFLLVGYFPRVSAGGIALMSLSFFLLIGLTRVITGEFPADCGCFGENSFIKLEPQQVFVMDGVNFLIALKLASLKRPLLSLDRLLT